jgi:murein DD-endopeptidase MepM/ murein hydrolase activator NlpD
MKKHSLAEFLKSKSFYVLLGIGALAIIAITVVTLNQPSSNKEEKYLADLNEPNEVADNDVKPTEAPNTTPSDTTKNNLGSTDDGKDVATVPTEPGGNDGYLENDPVDDPKFDNAVAEKNATDKANQTADAKKDTEKDAAVTEETEQVMTLETLYFDVDKGLSWPINGDVLLKYSADQVVYFKTLEQFRTNPALIIDAKIGAEVNSAATGIITSIKKVDETGVTVTVNIGSGYNLIYGQMEKDSLKFKVGDVVNKGDVLGTVAKPTMYYSVEGSNLYFMVEKDNDSVDPLTLLKK